MTASPKRCPAQFRVSRFFVSNKKFLCKQQRNETLTAKPYPYTLNPKTEGFGTRERITKRRRHDYDPNPSTLNHKRSRLNLKAEPNPSTLCESFEYDPNHKRSRLNQSEDEEAAGDKDNLSPLLPHASPQEVPCCAHKGWRDSDKTGLSMGQLWGWG